MRFFLFFFEEKQVITAVVVLLRRLHWETRVGSRYVGLEPSPNQANLKRHAHTGLVPCIYVPVVRFTARPKNNHTLISSTLSHKTPEVVTI